MYIYIVQPGDTLAGIAAFTGLPEETISYENQLAAPYNLVPGLALLITSTGGVPENTGETAFASPPRLLPVDAPVRPSIYTGGYAYPFIDPYVLTQTLPYLTDLYIFSYGFTPEGDLVPPWADDSWMIDLAKGYGTAPILTLTPFGPDGNFNNNLISAVVNNPDARQNLIQQLAAQITTRGFEGVDVDFEYILASDRDAFSEFVVVLKEAVAPLGATVSVALAPKTSSTQTGLLYEGKDYAALGAAADYVLLMTYEWGYTYGPPMAVAPLNKVREVIDYAVTEIPTEKINLGIPNYGYDWPLPYERGVTAAVTISNALAVQRAIEKGAPVQFDTTAEAPYYRYISDSIEHEVWFQDVRSMNATFDLITEYGLRGAGYWNIMRLFRANWLLLENRFDLYF